MTEIIVLGAGMVGVSAALELQARGHRVVLVDRRGAGEETSYGNAGFIQAEAAEPHPIPHDPMTLLSYAFGRSNDVVYDPKYLPALAPVLWRYFRASAPKRHRAISKIYAQLTRRSTADHAPLIAAAGAEALIRRNGYADVYRSAHRFEAAARRAEALARDYGVSAGIEDSAALAKAEPAIRVPLAGAVLWHDCWTCADPGALTAAYAALFERRGGTFVRGDALSLRQAGAGWSVETARGLVTGEKAVVALGPWSPELLARFGYGIQMLWKRGYHGHFDSPVRLARPFLDAENGILLTPMRKGLRLATGAALVQPTDPSDPVQLRRGIAAASGLVPLGARVEEPQWFGNRPCLPDMLPLVGPAPNHAGLWFDFGHGHQGFTLGPTTAHLLAERMEGARSEVLDALDPAHRKGTVSLRS